MNARRQYALTLAAAVTFAIAGVLGFRATGGALPYAKRFHKVVTGGGTTGTGPLVQPGRAPGESVFGVVLAGPIRKGGLVGEFVGLLAVLAVAGVVGYWYATRRARAVGR